jgi:hypothetical protein
MWSSSTEGKAACLAGSLLQTLLCIRVVQHDCPDSPQVVQVPAQLCIAAVRLGALGFAPELFGLCAANPPSGPGFGQTLWCGFLLTAPGGPLCWAPRTRNQREGPYNDWQVADNPS